MTCEIVTGVNRGNAKKPLRKAASVVQIHL